MGDWCLIESDPAVFTELINRIGVEEIEVEEIWSLEQSIKELVTLKVYGLIFLFNYTKDRSNLPQQSTTSTGYGGGESGGPVPESLFFAHQVINNACATQAILSILLNTKGVDLGPTLTEFKQFAAELPPDMKGLTISNSDIIRSVHNSFARANPFVLDNYLKDEKDEDAFHFVAYIPFEGFFFELDGLKPAPINHGPIGDEHWTDGMKQVIQKRIDNFSGTEIRFNLMAVIAKRETLLRKQLSVIEQRLGNTPNDEMLNVQKSEIISRLRTEEEKHLRYRKDNERRRHNFVPLILEFLKILGEQGKLPK